jgi:hypothetical protein
MLLVAVEQMNHNPTLRAMARPRWSELRTEKPTGMGTDKLAHNLRCRFH